MHDPRRRQPADRLELSLRLEFRALAIRNSDIQLLGESVLNANLPSSYIPSKNTLAIDLLNDPKLDQDSNAKFQIRARQMIQAALETFIHPNQCLQNNHSLLPGYSVSYPEFRNRLPLDYVGFL